MAAPGPNPNFFNPAGDINFCVGRVDEAANCIFLDLGNGLRSKTPGSGMANLGDLDFEHRQSDCHARSSRGHGDSSRDDPGHRQPWLFCRRLV